MTVSAFLEKKTHAKINFTYRLIWTIRWHQELTLSCSVRWYPEKDCNTCMELRSVNTYDSESQKVCQQTRCPHYSDFPVCQPTCLNLFLPTCLDRLSTVGDIFVCLLLSCPSLSFRSISGLSVLVLLVWLSLSGIPRLSMQPVMRCMLQSACEELIRKQQRPSHINRHVCVCLCVCGWGGCEG